MDSEKCGAVNERSQVQNNLIFCFILSYEHSFNASHLHFKTFSSKPNDRLAPFSKINNFLKSVLIMRLRSK